MIRAYTQAFSQALGRTDIDSFTFDKICSMIFVGSNYISHFFDFLLHNLLS